MILIFLHNEVPMELSSSNKMNILHMPLGLTTQWLEICLLTFHVWANVKEIKAMMSLICSWDMKQKYKQV